MARFHETTNGRIPFTEEEEAERDAEEAAAALPEVPSYVTMRQCRMALLNASLLSSVQSFVATQSDEVKIFWEFSIFVERAHPLVEIVRVQLGKTNEEIDALFIAANLL